MNDEIPVSVVIPCFCCANTIKRAVDSIAQQTQKPAELILVDDASSDNTAEILHQIASQYPSWVKVISLLKNQGVANARNAGWDAAGQPYIAFLDADDVWHPKKLEIQYRWMSENKEFGLVGHGYLLLKNDNDTWPAITSNFQLRPVKKLNALFTNAFSTKTVMLKRDLTLRFVEGKRYSEDYLLWLEIIYSDVPAIYIEQSLAATFKYDYGEAGLSAQLWNMEKGELDTYYQMYKKGYIFFTTMSLVMMYSLIKYVRRYVITRLRFIKWNLY
jgi:glycosyltransferase involved in cell wall biosynthesis